MKYIGIDIGGMSIKCGAVDEKGAIVAKCAAPTPLRDPQAAVDVMASLCRQAVQQAQWDWADVAAVGVGAPGTVCHNVVTYASNLGWHNVPLAQALSQAVDKPVSVGNDANCALLAEWKLGAAVGYDNVAMITLGTGIGTAFIVDGRLLLGNGGAAGEGGHIRVKQLGNKCGCGREDCWELYASASSLLCRTKALAAAQPNGICAQVVAQRGKVDGHALFEAIAQGDQAAREVLQALQTDIADGLANIANLLRPQVVVMGGGICAQDSLVAPLEEMLNARMLGGEFNPRVRIVRAHFFNDAGIVGAAAQVMA